MKEIIENYNTKLISVGKTVYDHQPTYSPVTKSELVDFLRYILRSRMTKRRSDSAVIFGDKCPNNAKYAFDLMTIFPDAKFINIFRDPRDVAVSRLYFEARVYSKEVLNQNSDLYRKYINESCKEWKASWDISHAMAMRQPSNCLLIRYEDCLENYSRIVFNMLAFLDVSTDPSLIDKIVQLSSFEAMSGRKTGHEDKNSFYRKGVKNDWRNDLSDDISEYILKYCEDGMRLLNYL